MVCNGGYQMKYGMILSVFLIVLTLSAGATAALSDKPQVIIETTKGAIVLELYPDEAPKTVDNFLRYARWGTLRRHCFPPCNP